MFVALSYIACSFKVRCSSILCHLHSAPHANGGILPSSWLRVQRSMRDQSALAQKQNITLSTFHWQKQSMGPLKFDSVVLYSLRQRLPWWQQETGMDGKQKYSAGCSRKRRKANISAVYQELYVPSHLAVILSWPQPGRYELFYFFCSWGSWIQADSLMYLKSQS